MIDQKATGSPQHGSRGDIPLARLLPRSQPVEQTHCKVAGDDSSSPGTQPLLLRLMVLSHFLKVWEFVPGIEFDWSIVCSKFSNSCCAGGIGLGDVETEGGFAIVAAIVGMCRELAELGEAKSQQRQSQKLCLRNPIVAYDLDLF
eukprot:1136942-Amphidinium_carterae.1